MMSYSPYDNIKPNTKYPNLFVKAGINNPRVQYWEPAKWVAKMRASNTNVDSNRSTLIFDCKMGSGHIGASGRYGHLKDKAIEYAFIA
ncbi:protease 2 [Obelidium mucronatum]|nr:protease 2 [Obelidium mucronatum]